MDQAIKPLLTTAEVASIYRVSEKTLIRWRKAGVGPPIVELPNGGIRYDPAVIEADIKAGATGEAVAQ